MFRVALHGDIAEAEKLIPTIRSFSNCIVSGISTSITGSEHKNQSLLDHPVQIFNTAEEILTASDIIVFMNYKNETINLVRRCLKESRHIFINPEELIHPEILSELIKLAEEAGVILYLFHKSFIGNLSQLIDNHPNAPEFIDIYRYIIPDEEFSNNLSGLLTNELLYLNAITQFPIKKYKLSTVPYCSDKPFIINLRLEFTNGGSANITINTFTGLDSRFSELYFSDGMIHVNTLEKRIQHKIWNSEKSSKYDLESLIRDERNLDLEIAEFINKISKISFPLKNYGNGYNLYFTLWELIKELIPSKLLN